MTSQKKPGDAGSEAFTSSGTKDVLKPFQDASAKFLQATFSAQEVALKQRAQAWLDFQDEVRKGEQEAYQAVMAATRKHVNTMGQPVTGNMEEMHSARAKTQLEYEKEVRQIYADTQAKMTAIAQKVFGEGGGGEPTKQASNPRQDAYQAYLTDLQQAWSGIKALDPQTMNAIASSIMYTINAANQGS